MRKIFNYSMIPKFMHAHGKFYLRKVLIKPDKIKHDKIPYCIDGKRAKLFILV